jgi:serine/threonine transporter
MKKIIEKWNSINLILRILIGMLVGIALAFIVPSASWIQIFGTLFVGALKAIAPVLVFVLVISALANANMNIGNKFRTVIFLYILTTFLAAVLAVASSFIFPVTISLPEAVQGETAPEGLGEVITALLMNIVDNPVKSIMNANYIGILAWAVAFGVALRKLASDNTKVLLENLSDAVSAVIRGIISFAPFGIMGLVFQTVSENGLDIFTQYGKLLLLLIGTMFTMSFIINPIVSGIFIRKNPYPLVFRCLRESGLTAFFTRSSAANIPVNMALCEKLGLDKNLYSVSIPLGATINMDGAAITITVMTLAAARTLGIEVDFMSAIILSALATLAACGASGVAGGSLLLIPMACSLFGINNDIAMQVVAVGFIIGVVQDSVETALNSSGDVLFAATAEFHDRMKQEKKQNK